MSRREGILLATASAANNTLKKFLLKDKQRSVRAGSSLCRTRTSLLHSVRMAVNATADNHNQDISHMPHFFDMQHHSRTPTVMLRAIHGTSDRGGDQNNSNDKDQFGTPQDTVASGDAPIAMPQSQSDSDDWFLHIGPSGDYWTGASLFAAKHLQPGYVKSIPIPKDSQVTVEDHMEDLSVKQLQAIFDKGELPEEMMVRVFELTQNIKI
jgi:cytochrome c1